MPEQFWEVVFEVKLKAEVKASSREEAEAAAEEFIKDELCWNELDADYVRAQALGGPWDARACVEGETKRWKLVHLKALTEDEARAEAETLHSDWRFKGCDLSTLHITPHKANPAVY